MYNSLQELYRAYREDEKLNKSKPEGAKFVAGDGYCPAQLMIIGEAPGEVEDKIQLPFMGPSGEVLNTILSDLGIYRNSEHSIVSVFITNVYKYRPPNNQMPLPVQWMSSVKYLKEEVHLVNPRVIVPMGLLATRAFFPMTFKSVRNRPIKRGDRYIFPTYHPATTFYDPRILTQLKQDFAWIRNILDAGFETDN